MFLKKKRRPRLVISLLVLLIFTLIILVAGFFVSNAKMHKEVGHVLDITRYSYIKFYSLARETRLLFDFSLQDLDNPHLTQTEKEKLRKVCTFHVEEGLERLEIAQGYDCLVRLYDKNSRRPAELYKAIKNGSYGLDVLYTKSGAQNLLSLIISGYEKEGRHIVSQEPRMGYAKDEIPFLHKLIALNIPELTARCLYRMSLIHLLGRASFEDTPIDTNLKLAVQELQEVIKITDIKQDSVLDIALTINDKFAAHAAVTISSALLNADLDSYYRFHIVMNPDDPVSLESQEKLAAMQYIRNYSIDFTNFPNEIISQDLLSKITFPDHWPLIVMYRLYLDRIFPELQSILYLDSDIVVLRDLTMLKQINIANYIAAGSFDWSVMYCASSLDQDCKKTLANSYKNGGVLFFNLQQMRDMHSDQKFLEAVVNSRCAVKYLDQDILVIAFHDYLYHLPVRWNHNTLFDNITPYFANFVSHYEGSEKPWTSVKQKLWKTSPEQLSENTKAYWRYRELTPWTP